MHQPNPSVLIPLAQPFSCKALRAFFKNLSVGGGGIYKKGPYYTERREMIDSLLITKKFGVVSHLHYAVDRLNLQLSTCIVCLCRYHNLAVTQGASLINSEGPTPTKRHHGWHRRKILKILRL